MCDEYFTIALKEYRLPEVIPAKLDEKTGLKKRKLSYLQKAGIGLAKRVLRGESPMHAITGAISDGGLNAKQKNYLQVYKAVSKQGGLEPGDVLTIAAGQIARNGKKIPAATSSSGSEGELV